MINPVERTDRVRVVTAPAEVETFAIFVAQTPGNEMIFAAEGSGLEWRVPVESVVELETAKITCPECSVAHNVARSSGRCADCERSWASRQPAPSETCEACGDLGAVYSPRAKSFLCLQDLARGGFLTGLGPEARVLTQGVLCRSDDIHSTRHDWRKSKSSYLCRECKVKVFEKPAGFVG